MRSFCSPAASSGDNAQRVRLQRTFVRLPVPDQSTGVCLFARSLFSRRVVLCCVVRPAEKTAHHASSRAAFIRTQDPRWQQQTDAAADDSACYG